MTVGEERDAFTGVYKTNDPIQNFKIRVHLRHVKAAHIPLPQFVNEDQERDLDGASSASATASVTVSGTSQVRGNNSEDEIKTFAWQEKVFSRYEVELYSDISNCHTALQEQYHKEIKTTIHRQTSQQDRLFSYVHNDNVSSIQEDEDTPVLSSEPNFNHLVTAMRKLQMKQRYVPRKFFRREKMRRRQVLVQEGQGNAEFHLQGLPQAACQRMYIMADLSSSNDIGANEYVLCVIRWNAASGSLFVSPDICGSATESKPYRIEVDGDARNVYEYWLELASSDTSEEEKIREAEVRSKVYRHQSDLRKARIGDEFSTCQSGSLSVHVFGQINILRNFDDHNLFVHYFIELPKGWSSESETLSGVSASCKATNGFVHLGHPVHFNLKLSLSELEDSSDFVPRWPQLMFEVLSLDWWGRYRTEGYGYVTLPSAAGLHHATTHTWRPIGNSPANELRRFFIGGNPELDDVTFVGIPHQHEGPLLGKYGVRTAPSGSVETVFNVVLQSSSPPGKAATAAAPSALLERLSAATLVSSVNQVLAAFRRAHERMLAAKQGLDLKDLKERKDLVLKDPVDAQDLKDIAQETATDTQ